MMAIYPIMRAASSKNPHTVRATTAALALRHAASNGHEQVEHAACLHARRRKGAHNVLSLLFHKLEEHVFERIVAAYLFGSSLREHLAGADDRQLVAKLFDDLKHVG